ncbi:MAG: ATP-binding cassette domain-containing protein [Holosporales bacterium]|jgi:polar amino acid transport system ATP-binding protein|nr:ATP-binding cassette domain-containing protein [Holosporales bacterium]
MLKICDICKSFNGIEVLNNVSLDIEESSILGLAGSSGSGKSTLLRCIQGLEIPDHGTINYDRKIGFMFQDFNLFPHMTVLQNLVYAPSLRATADEKKRYIDKARDMLKDLGIAGKESTYPGTLSGGQKQRVALARSLMIDPEVLLCDEPTSGLDVATIEDVVGLLRKVNGLGVTIVVASHDLEFLAQICGRIVLLRQGKILLDIDPRDNPIAIENLKNSYT